MPKTHLTCGVVHRDVELSKAIWFKGVAEFEQVFLYLRAWGFPEVFKEAGSSANCTCFFNMSFESRHSSKITIP